MGWPACKPQQPSQANRRANSRRSADRGRCPPLLWSLCGHLLESPARPPNRRTCASPLFLLFPSPRAGSSFAVKASETRARLSLWLALCVYPFDAGLLLPPPLLPRCRGSSSYHTNAVSPALAHVPHAVAHVPLAVFLVSHGAVCVCCTGGAPWPLGGGDGCGPTTHRPAAARGGTPLCVAAPYGGPQQRRRGRVQFSRPGR